MKHPKRLIEVDLPIARISAHARREKSIRHGHISTLHIWWARRPLAACRAVICAALWPDPTDEHCPQTFRDAAATQLVAFARRVNPEKITEEKQHLQETLSPESRVRWEVFAKNDPPLDPKDASHQNVLRFALLDFIADFANWDNSTIPAYLETSRALTQSAHEALGGEPGTRPLVVDPFAGGGSIPLEALRVGADAFASDLNPVAVLLNKVVLEYIPKYGQKLADEVRKWGAWIKEQAEKELAEFYPKDHDGATPIAYLWARTIISEAPDQSGVPVEVPLIRSMWLVKKQGRRRALRWVRDPTGEIQTQSVEKAYADGVTRKIRQPLLEVFQPQSVTESLKGTSTAGTATCPLTQFTTSVESVRAQVKRRSGGSADARLVGVVVLHPNTSGRIYRLPTSQDIEAAQNAAVALEERKRAHFGPLPFLPTGQLNHLRGFFNVVLYGMTEWGQLFSPRQSLVLTTLLRLVRSLSDQLSNLEGGLRAAVQSCLALAVSRHADINASLGMWHTTRELITHVFGRQALPMVWDFAEANPFCDASGAFAGGVDWIARVLEQNAFTPGQGQAEQASATKHPLPDHFVDAVITDPPYYAAIPYADLSDFFYSWLRPGLRDVHSQLFASELTPKADECVQLSHRAAMYRNKDAEWFETMMTRACSESCRITKPSGVSVFVFANKETSGWEAMLAALISAGWVITASWPIDTEMGNRLRARNSAVLASSVHLVCRPRTGKDVGDWRDVLSELPRQMHEWMPRLASEGVVGADAIFACLGPALEIFSRHGRVEKASGEAVLLKEYLEHVWAAVSKEAISTIFRDADASGLEPDARLTAMWLWTVGGGKSVQHRDTEGTGGEQEEEQDDEEKAGNNTTAAGFTLEFDAARMIAQGLGIHLERSESIVEVKGDKARLLPVAERTNHLFGKDQSSGGSQPAARRKKKPQQSSLFAELNQAEEAEGGWRELKGPPPGTTSLDQLHQAMILFGAQRGELLKRFLVEDGVGKDARFWKLAQSLAALYPPGTDERRWVEGVLARKKGLGL